MNATLHPIPKTLLALMLAFAAGSLVHFIHNAEFLKSYPGLPPNWTRAGVYGAWLGISGVGGAGYALLRHGYQRTGLLVVAAYALFGMDSLGHYLLAPMSAHSLGMNATILLEVVPATLLLCLALGLLARRSLGARP